MWKCKCGNDLMWGDSVIFGTDPKCGACIAKESANECEHGLHKNHVCSKCLNKGFTLFQDTTHKCTLEEAAMDIIEMNGSNHHWAEFLINAGGNLVNIEVVVSYLNGHPMGKMFKPDTRYSKIIKWIFRI